MHAGSRPLTFAFFFQATPGGGGEIPLASLRRINVVAAAARAHHPGSHAWLLTDDVTKTKGLHASIGVFRVKNLSPRPARVLVNRLVAEVRFLRKLAEKERKSAGTADHVVFLDATDVVLLKPVGNVLRKWNKPGSRFDIAMPYRDLTVSPSSSSSQAAAAVVEHRQQQPQPPQPSVSPALRFVPGSRLLRAAQFLDAVRATYLVSFPPAKGAEAEGFRNEQRAYAHVLSASAGFRPELFKRGSKGFRLRAPVVDAAGETLDGSKQSKGGGESGSRGGGQSS